MKKKYILECKIGCLGPQRGRLPWASQQMTNYGRSFALRVNCQKICFERFLYTERILWQFLPHLHKTTKCVSMKVAKKNLELSSGMCRGVKKVSLIQTFLTLAADRDWNESHRSVKFRLPAGG